MYLSGFWKPYTQAIDSINDITHNLDKYAHINDENEGQFRAVPYQRDPHTHRSAANVLQYDEPAQNVSDWTINTTDKRVWIKKESFGDANRHEVHLSH